MKNNFKIILVNKLEIKLIYTLIKILDKIIY